MAARATRVIFINETDLDLIKTNDHLEHGSWSDASTQPPDQVRHHTSVEWTSESKPVSIATGTAGWVRFGERSAGLHSKGPFLISWDNPYIGNNSYHAEAPPGFKFTQSGGSGDIANVTFDLTKI